MEKTYFNDGPQGHQGNLKGLKVVVAFCMAYFFEKPPSCGVLYIVLTQYGRVSKEVSKVKNAMIGSVNECAPLLKWHPGGQLPPPYPRNATDNTGLLLL